MTTADIIAAFSLCAAGGASLALLELLRTLGAGSLRHIANRYVGALVLLNAASACLVYAFLRYALHVESNLWVVALTGMTFPAILRSRFVLYQTPRGALASAEAESFAICLDDWHRRLQHLCLDEVNSRIADEHAATLRSLRTKLSEKEMIELLADHIVAESWAESQKRHCKQLSQVVSLASPADRLRRLARLLIDVLPEERVERLTGGRRLGREE